MNKLIIETKKHIRYATFIILMIIAVALPVILIEKMLKVDLTTVQLITIGFQTNMTTSLHIKY